jgi:hypothetical protein
VKKLIIIIFLKKHSEKKKKKKKKMYLGGGGMSPAEFVGNGLRVRAVETGAGSEAAVAIRVPCDWYFVSYPSVFWGGCRARVALVFLLRNRFKK